MLRAKTPRNCICAQNRHAAESLQAVDVDCRHSGCTSSLFWYRTASAMTCDRKSRVVHGFVHHFSASIADIIHKRHPLQDFLNAFWNSRGFGKVTFTCRSKSLFIFSWTAGSFWALTGGKARDSEDIGLFASACVSHSKMLTETATPYSAL